MIYLVALVELASVLAVDAAGFCPRGRPERPDVRLLARGSWQRSFRLLNLSAPVGPITSTSPLTAARSSTSATVPPQTGSIPAAASPGAARALSAGGFAGATAGHVKFYDSTGRVLYDVLAPLGGPIVALSFGISPSRCGIPNGDSLVRANRFSTGRSPRGRRSPTPTPSSSSANDRRAWLPAGGYTAEAASARYSGTLHARSENKLQLLRGYDFESARASPPL